MLKDERLGLTALPTKYCELFCDHCGFGADSSRPKTPSWSRDKLADFLSLFGEVTLTYSGGEPLETDFSYFRELPENVTKTRVVSSGLPLLERGELFDGLLDSDVDWLLISTDSFHREALERRGYSLEMLVERIEERGGTYHDWGLATFGKKMKVVIVPHEPMIVRAGRAKKLELGERELPGHCCMQLVLDEKGYFHSCGRFGKALELGRLSDGPAVVYHAYKSRKRRYDEFDSRLREIAREEKKDVCEVCEKEGRKIMDSLLPDN